MSTLRCAVVGVGYLGRFHAQKYKTLESTGACQLVAVCDSSLARADEIGKELGVKAETDFKKLAGKVDAVTIAADTTVHYEVAKFFLSNGIHVLVEKPVASASPEGAELAEMARESGLTLQVGHIERFNPAWTSAAQYIDQICFADFQRLAPFGPRSNAKVDVVVDLMVHDLDLLMSLDPSPVMIESAKGWSHVTPLIDIAVVRMRFDSGMIANMVASRVATTVFRRAILVQKNSSINIDFGALTFQRTVMGGAQPEIVAQTFEKTDALLLEVESFVEAIRLNKPPRVTGFAGVQALQMAELIVDKIKHE